MIKAAIFDWGGVLIDEPSEGLKKFCAEMVGLSPEIFDSFFQSYSHLFHTGRITESEVWEEIGKKLNRKIDHSGSIWKEAVLSVFREKEGMFELVRELRDSGLKTGFLSNTEMPAYEVFLEKGMDKMFDRAVFSCIEGIAKPDKEIYMLACERLGVLPGEAVFIDDKKENVKGAETAGLEVILFENPVKLRNDLLKHIRN